MHFRQKYSSGLDADSSRAKSVRKAPRAIFSLWQPSLPPTFDSWWADLSPEFHLMLACLRLSPSEKEIRQIADLSRSEINWNSLLSLVDRHRTAPLVYQNLRRYGNNRAGLRYGPAALPVSKAIPVVVLPMPRNWCACPNSSGKTRSLSFPLRAASWPSRFMATWPCAMPGILTCWWRRSTLSSPIGCCEPVITAFYPIFS